MNPNQQRPLAGVRPIPNNNGIRPQMATPPGIRPVNAIGGAPIRPIVQGQQVIGQQPMRPAAVNSPNRPAMMSPSGAAAAGNMRPIMAQSAPGNSINPHIGQLGSFVGSPQVRPNTIMSPQQQQANLVNSMQNLQVQQPMSPPQQQYQQNHAPPSNKPRRVYPTNSEASPRAVQQQTSTAAQQQAPWPNSLQQQQSQQNQQQYQQQQQQQYQQPYRPQAPYQQTLIQPLASAPIASPQRGARHQSSAAGVGYTNAPYAHTGQDLPPELRPPTQPRPRIDPDNMPAPVQVRENDEAFFDEKFFDTTDRDHVPLATTHYIGLDQGNCNPRFMRSTVDRIPINKEITDKSKLPLGLVITPLAKSRYDEVAIQTVHHGEEGPVRCTRCRAYINPWCVFTHGGSKFECNICAHSNEVPDWYFANIDMSGRRVDADQRPELRYGSVEFEVPLDYYSARAPVPLSYVFALDVSVQAVQSGMLQAVCEGLKTALYDHERNAKMLSRIGIVTFDKDVHFYNLHPTLTNAQMLVVPDIDDMFVPLQDGFLASLVESKNIVTQLLDTLPQMFRDTMRAESVYTSAVRGGLHALKETGGQVFVFQTCLPNYGADILKSRDDKSLYGTDKEKNLLEPQSSKYKDLAVECVKSGVCINTWAFASQYMDIATIDTLSHLTGGDLRYYPNFKLPEKFKIAFQLSHDLHRETGFDGIFRIRCSDGLQVLDHYGNCHMSTYTDIDTPGMDEDKSITAILKHDGKLDVNRGVSFQSALLYTNRSGQRRVRVHNLRLAATTNISDVFRYGDVDTTVSVLLRKAIFDVHHKSRKEIQKVLTDQCVDILTAYRVCCAASTAPGQLILPEAFKLLPVYIHGAMRSAVLRGVGEDINIDVRSASMSMFNTLTVAELVWTLYPRMYALHNMENAESDHHDMKRQIKLPPMVRTSYERLEPTGCYVVDTGSDLYFWLGSKISSNFLKDVFGVETLDQVDPNMIHLPTRDTEISTKIHSIMGQLQSMRSKYLSLRIVRQEKDKAEFLFSTWMSEDRNAEVQTYVDYMCVLHRKIQEEMKKAS